MNSKLIAVVTVVILSVAVGSVVRTCRGRESLPSVKAAVKELSAPDDEEDVRAATLALENHGERAFPQILALYQAAAPPATSPEAAPAPAAEGQPAPPPAASAAEAQQAKRRAVAVGLLTSLPATPQVVAAVVEALGRETHPSLRQGLADYLRQAAGMAFNDRPAEDGVADLGSDPAAWRSWWEREGQNMTVFHAPYGTETTQSTTP